MNVKTILNTGLLGLGLGLVNTSIAASDKAISDVIQQASYIQLAANNGQDAKLADFLKNGSKLVRETEPQTKIWFALQGEESTFGIFDVFHDNEGRAAHFAGKVASALHDNAAALINGGWDQGVLSNVHNSEILACSDYKTDNVLKATRASYILLKALPGKEKALASLLKDAAPVITKTEPGTSFWLALKLDEHTYAIFDAFVDEAARKDHFEGIVAKTLKNKADNLIAGGWQGGVLNNIQNFNIIASS